MIPLQVANRPSDAAMHEAGHCVVSAHHGDRGLSVTIAGGRPQFRHFPTPRTGMPAIDQRQGLRLVHVAIAGAVAETVGTGRRWRPYVSHTDLNLLIYGLDLLDVDVMAFIRDMDLLDELEMQPVLRMPEMNRHARAVRRLLAKPSIANAVLRLARLLDVEGTVDVRDRIDLFEDVGWWVSKRVANRFRDGHG